MFSLLKTWMFRCLEIYHTFCYASRTFLILPYYVWQASLYDAAVSLFLCNHWGNWALNLIRHCLTEEWRKLSRCHCTWNTFKCHLRYLLRGIAGKLILRQRKLKVLLYIDIRKFLAVEYLVPSFANAIYW